MRAQIGRPFTRAVLGFVCIVLGACVSVPATPDRPQVGCHFDALLRWRYVLILERDAEVVRWRPRRKLTALPDPADREVRLSPASEVRSGWCRDEVMRLTDREP